MSRRRRRGAAFTLVEAMVAAVLVSIGVVAVFGGIGALKAAEARARDADLLQSLALQKLNEVGPVSSPDTVETDGDFADQGYPDVTWSVEVQPSGAENVDTVTVTATRGDREQAETVLVFVPPLTATAAGATSP